MNGPRPNSRDLVSLDHVGLVGHNLGTMISAYRQLGFSPTEPRSLLQHDAASGAETSLEQRSAHLMFKSGYVELSAVDSRDAGHHLATYAQRYEGLHILALGVPDADDAARRLRARGLAITEPSIAARDVAYGERSGVARFRWFMLTPRMSPEALICCVQQLTPDIVHQRAVQSHFNGAVQLLSATLVTSDARQGAALLGDIANVAVSADSEGWCVPLRHGQVIVRSPAQFARVYAGTALPEMSGLAAMTIGVHSLSALTQLGTDPTVPIRCAAGRSWIEPTFAAGALVEFVESVSEEPPR